MIRLHRPELSKESKEYLENCKLDWDNNLKDQVAFLEVKSLLMFANGGINACMYCTCGEAGTLDHFWPQAVYKERTYRYNNYVWSCYICNNAKSTDFPVDQSGNPLLVNPLDEDPHPYFNYNQGGIFKIEEEPNETSDQCQIREKNNRTVDTMNLDRGTLIRHRADAWKMLPMLLAGYARGEIERSQLIGPPFIAVLIYFWKMRAKPEIIGVNAVDILAKHPEIGTWVDPKVRSYSDYRQQWDACIGKKLSDIKEAEKLTLVFETSQLTLPLPKKRGSQQVLSRKLKYYFLADRTLTFHFHNKDTGDFTFSLDDLDKMTP